MVSTFMIYAHQQSQSIYESILNSKDFSYKSAPMKDIDYENDILLEEDDECPFVYEESNVPKILTNEEI